MTKQPQTSSIPIVTDPALVDAYTSARQELDDTAERLLRTFVDRAAMEAAVSGKDLLEERKRLRDADADLLTELNEKVEASQAALRAASTVYTFRSIGYKAWRAMKAAHKSTDPAYAFDQDSIAPTLLREASSDPKLSAEMVEEILTSPDWSEGEVELLLRAAVAAQS